jgi:hypothetical protein
MLRLFLCLIITSLLSSVVFADKITRVIYITLDGTRWQDVFIDRTHFQKLWGKYEKELTFYGKPGSRSVMHVATLPTSLPSYQSQTAGSVQFCFDNDCGRIQTQTFLENILHKLHLRKKDVVTFASWPGIGEAAESVFNITYTNVGNVPMYDPETHLADPVMAKINSEQLNDGAGDGDRHDKYTIEQALHYLETYKPRFMWIALNDADAKAHQGNLEAYHQTLDRYDTMMDRLFTMLKSMKLDKETMVIVTTDHGRGNNNNWTTHGILYPESVRTWAFVKNGALRHDFYDGSVYYYSTLSIRPTIESTLLVG